MDSIGNIYFIFTLYSNVIGLKDVSSAAGENEMGKRFFEYQKREEK